MYKYNKYRQESRFTRYLKEYYRIEYYINLILPN